MLYLCLLFFRNTQFDLSLQAKLRCTWAVTLFQWVSKSSSWPTRTLVHLNGMKPGRTRSERWAAAWAWLRGLWQNVQHQRDKKLGQHSKPHTVCTTSTHWLWAWWLSIYLCTLSLKAKSAAYFIAWLMIIVVLVHSWNNSLYSSLFNSRL